MFFISRSVAGGIRALGKRDDVQRELAAIRAMPGYEVYANAIAEGVAEGGTRRGGRPRANAEEPQDDGDEE